MEFSEFLYLQIETVLLGRKKKEDAGTNNISEKVTRAYKQWHDKLILAVRVSMPADNPYVVLHTESLVGLFTCIFVRREIRASMASPYVTTIKRGMKGFYGNKVCSLYNSLIARLISGIGRYRSSCSDRRLFSCFHQLSSCCGSES